MAYLNFKKTLKVVKTCLFPYIKSRLNGYPLWVHFYLTRRCNLRCKYCFVRDNDKKELNTEGVKKVIDKLHSLGIRIIAFFGGEPTLRKDFCQILEYANKKGLLTYFTTNGTLLNEDYIERIAKTGIDFIEISVDNIFEFDDSKKIYTRSKRILELLIKAGKKYGFGIKTHLVLTGKNADSAIQTINKINNLKIPLTVGLVFRNVYNDSPDDESLYFNDERSKDELTKLIDEIIKIKKRGVQIIDPISYFRGMNGYINGKTNWGCRAGAYFFSVDCDGAVQLCCSLKPFSTNIMSIEKDYFKNKQKEIKDMLTWCQKKCYSNCSFTTSYLINHPLKALL